jgi:hypothetical protein
MEKWITVYTSNNRIRTELITNELINKGINAVILDKIDANFPVLGPIAIHVPEEQAEEAIQYIEEISLNEEP